MISETYFSNNYTSVWKSLTPSMEDFVRRWNMDGFEREWPPIPSQTDADRRGLINEAGFILFSMIIHRSRADAKIFADTGVTDSFLRAAEYVYGSESNKHSKATPAEKREAQVISGRLYNYFLNQKKTDDVVVSPKFYGSGLIASCTGDVLVGKSKIIEVKSGDRKSRSVDYRQLLVYSTLNFAKTGVVVEQIGIVNPRTGVTIMVDIDIFAREISGQSAVSLFQSLIEAFSGNLISL